MAVDASGIRKVFDLAAKMKDPINLSIGLPHFDVPQEAKAAAIAAIESGQNRYTQTQGITPLRERLRQSLSTEMGRDVGEVLITSGAAGGLFLAILATLDAGDEAIVLDPYFVMYKHMLTMAGAKGVIVNTYDDFRFPADRIEAAITPKTRVMVLNTPANPTGVVLSESDVRTAVKVACRHNLVIICDEVYEPFLYEKAGKTGTGGLARLVSPASFYENTVVLRGFSKSHAMTGWRLGYVAGPEAILAQMTKLQQYTYVCAPAPLQYAALRALDIPIDAVVEEYRRKRDLVCGMLAGKFAFVTPQGAFYLFPKAPQGYTASEFVTKAIENNVLIIPGNVFSERDTHFRISYATTDEKLIAGCEVLNRIA